MKYLSLCLALGTALTLSACSTIPSKPKKQFKAPLSKDEIASDSVEKATTSLFRSHYLGLLYLLALSLGGVRSDQVCWLVLSLGWTKKSA